MSARVTPATARRTGSARSGVHPQPDPRTRARPARPWTRCHQPAVPQDGGVRADLLHLGQVMAGEHDGGTRGHTLGDGGAHLEGLGRVHAGGGLVEEQEVGRPEQRLGHRQPVAHAVGVLGDRPVDGRPQAGWPTAPSRSGSPPLRRIWRQAKSRFRRPDRWGTNPGPSTRAPTRPSTGAPGRTCSPKIEARPAVGRTKPEQDLQGEGLSRSVGPTRPMTWPTSTVRLRSSTAVTPLRSRLVRCSIRTAGGGVRPVPGHAHVGLHVAQAPSESPPLSASCSPPGIMAAMSTTRDRGGLVACDRGTEPVEREGHGPDPRPRRGHPGPDQAARSVRPRRRWGSRPVREGVPARAAISV